MNKPNYDQISEIYVGSKEKRHVRIRSICFWCDVYYSVLNDFFLHYSSYNLACSMVLMFLMLSVSYFILFTSVASGVRCLAHCFFCLFLLGVIIIPIEWETYIL